MSTAAATHQVGPPSVEIQVPVPSSRWVRRSTRRHSGSSSGSGSAPKTPQTGDLFHPVPTHGAQHHVHEGGSSEPATATATKRPAPATVGNGGGASAKSLARSLTHVHVDQDQGEPSLAQLAAARKAQAQAPQVQLNTETAAAVSAGCTAGGPLLPPASQKTAEPVPAVTAVEPAPAPAAKPPAKPRKPRTLKTKSPHPGPAAARPDGGLQGAGPGEALAAHAAEPPPPGPPLPPRPEPPQAKPRNGNAFKGVSEYRKTGRYEAHIWCSG